MTEFQKLISVGMADLNKQMPCSMKWGTYSVPGTPGESMTREALTDGGSLVVVESIPFIVLKSDLAKHSAGKQPGTGKKVTIDDRTLTVVSTSWDPTSPTITFTLEGEIRQ